MSEYHGIKCDCAFVPWCELEKFQIKRDDPAAVKCLLQQLEAYENVIQYQAKQDKTILGLLSQRDKDETEKKELMKNIEKLQKLLEIETSEKDKMFEEVNERHKSLKGRYKRLMEVVYFFRFWTRKLFFKTSQHKIIVREIRRSFASANLRINFNDAILI